MAKITSLIEASGCSTALHYELYKDGRNITLMTEISFLLTRNCVVNIHDPFTLQEALFASGYSHIVFTALIAPE
jgi:hypothetical protein